jgi:hypothetical protein
VGRSSTSGPGRRSVWQAVELRPGVGRARRSFVLAFWATGARRSFVLQPMGEEELHPGSGGARRARAAPRARRVDGGSKPEVVELRPGWWGGLALQHSPAEARVKVA